jgi:hypothetical protein
MRESNTRALKPKKLQTATMKRRALKLKSIEAAPTKARSPQVRALVVSAPQPSGMWDQPLPIALPYRSARPGPALAQWNHFPRPRSRPATDTAYRALW